MHTPFLSLLKDVMIKASASASALQQIASIIMTERLKTKGAMTWQDCLENCRADGHILPSQQEQIPQFSFCDLCFTSRSFTFTK